MDNYKVTVYSEYGKPSLEDLPEDLKEEYSFLSDSRGLLIVEHKGEIILVETDGGEAEDNYFFRDLGWISTALNRAYQLGLEDGGRVAPLIPELSEL